MQIQTLFAVWSLVGQAQVEGLFAKIAQVFLKPNTLNFETSRKMPTILQPKLLIPRILKPIILQPENLGKLKKCGRDLQCLGTLFCSYPMDDQRPPRKCLLLWSASKSSWRWTARAWEATRATAWDLPSIKKWGRYGGLGNNEEGLCWGFIVI